MRKPLKKTETLPISELPIRQGKVTFRRGTKLDIDSMEPYWFGADLPNDDQSNVSSGDDSGDQFDDQATDSPEIIDACKRYWRSLLENGEILLVGELNSQLVGRVFINVAARQKATSAIKVDHPTGIIERLKVSLEHQGIGRALVTNAEYVICSLGLSAAEIGVHQTNKRALKLYLDLGYTQLISDHEERAPSFEGFLTYRYQKPTAVLFKFLL
jgi:GNAT superfamily N-acetyltransferase